MSLEEHGRLPVRQHEPFRAKLYWLSEFALERGRTMRWWIFLILYDVLHCTVSRHIFRWHNFGWHIFDIVKFVTAAGHENLAVRGLMLSDGFRT